MERSPSLEVFLLEVLLSRSSGRGYNSKAQQNELSPQENIPII